MTEGPCEYCGKNAPEFMKELEVFLCGACKKLLANPATALPLIRGHLTLKLRGTIREETLKKWIDDYMNLLSSLKKKTRN